MHDYILIKIYIRHASKSMVQKTILVPSDESIFNEKQFHKQTKLSLHFPSSMVPIPSKNRKIHEWNKSFTVQP